jgi:hypothetical protein
MTDRERTFSDKVTRGDVEFLEKGIELNGISLNTNCP